MIKTKEMKPVLQRLCELAKPTRASKGRFTLSEHHIRKYETIRGYNEGFYYDIVDDDISYLRLDEVGRDGLDWMSCRPEEYMSYLPVVKFAKGKMLSLGLGLGLLPEMIRGKLDSKEVCQLDIVELNKDVANITWGYQKRPEINLIMEDAWDYIIKTEVRYDTVLADVASMPGNIVMAKLCSRLLNPGGEAFGWLQEINNHLREEMEPLELTSTSCRYCGVSPHMNYYGGLCRNCVHVLHKWSIDEIKRRGYNFNIGQKI